ncbi:MAG: hypothetical protein MUE53_08710 [Chitinophagales bacterium]|nr:hypothetical protein [Chitinophagales bacterium]
MTILWLMMYHKSLFGLPIAISSGLALLNLSTLAKFRTLPKFAIAKFFFILVLAFGEGGGTEVCAQVIDSAYIAQRTYTNSYVTI